MRFPVQHETNKSIYLLFTEEILQHLRTLCKIVEEGWPSLWCHKEYQVTVGDDVGVDDDYWC